MESKVSEDRPVSPKKKFRPSSTTSSDVQFSHHPTSVIDAVGAGNHVSSMPIVNGLAPTRSGRGISPSSSSSDSVPQRGERASISSASRSNTQSSTRSIQEEVVSSSENSVRNKKPSVRYTEGNADSLTNGEPEEAAVLPSSEAEERKEV